MDRSKSVIVYANGWKDPKRFQIGPVDMVERRARSFLNGVVGGALTFRTENGSDGAVVLELVENESYNFVGYENPIQITGTLPYGHNQLLLIEVSFVVRLSCIVYPFL